MKKKIFTKSALVRCTEAEIEKLHEKANETGLSLSRFLVKNALSDGKLLSAAEKEELKQLRFEVRKVGINLNQISHSLNLTIKGNSASITENEIKNTIEIVNKILSKILEKL